MAFLGKTGVSIAGLVVNDYESLGEDLTGRTVAVSMVGSGTTSGDSDYAFYQSNDQENWFALSGVTITDQGDTAKSVEVADIFNMRYFGWALSSKGTETTGTVTFQVMIK